MTISYGQLTERVGHYLFGVRGTLLADQLSDVEDCIRDGLYRVYSVHDWSFFRPVVDVTTTAPYVTGTVTIVAGVVTLVGGTFPTWADDGMFIVNSRYYSVASRGSGTQITLNDTSVTVADASDYSLGRPQIPMDATFEGVANDSDLVYLPGEDCWYPSIMMRHDSTVRKFEQSNPEFNRPVFYSVRTVEFDPEVGSRKVLAFYPTPDKEYVMRVPMILRPVTVGDANPYPIGGSMLNQAILEACLASAEHNFEEREHVHEKRFVELIGSAVRMDQERSSPTALGPDSPKGELGGFNAFDYGHRMREQRIGRLTINGDTV